MPIGAGDVLFLDADGTKISPGVHNLFGPVTGTDNADRLTDSRLVFVANRHRSLMFLDCEAWLDDKRAGGCVMQLAVDRAAAAPLSDIKTLGPSVFVGVGERVRVGHVPAGMVRGVWVRRTATDSPPFDDGVVLKVAGDTMP